MAKKDKEPKPRREAKSRKAKAVEAAPKKGFRKFLTKKILMIAVPALVVVLGGGGAGAYFFLVRKAAEEHARRKHEEEVPLTPPKVAFSDMQDIWSIFRAMTAPPPISSWAFRWNWKTKSRRPRWSP